MGFANPILGGGGALVYPSIHSPNFVTGVSGWDIKKDGSAEFDNLVIRGTFDGTDWVINSAGEFYYSSTPAAGNLVYSNAQTGGTDGFGNAYLAGPTTYVTTNLGTVLALNLTTFAGAFYAGALELQSAATFAGPFSSASTQILIRNGLIELTAAAQFDAAITATAGTSASPTLITTDSWHSLGNLGVAGISLSQARYRLATNGEVEFDISGSATGTVSASQTQFPNVLPAAYQPARERDIPVLFAAVVNRLRVQANGDVFLGYPALSSGNVITGTGMVPLD